MNCPSVAPVAKNIARAVSLIKGRNDVKSAILKQRRLEVRLDDDATNVAVLGFVFHTLNENKIALISIRSVGQQTEQAFLDLVEKEESRGFTRMIQNEAA